MNDHFQDEKERELSPDGQAGQAPARETALLIELEAQIL